MLDTSIEIGAEIFFSLVKKAYSSLTGYTQEHDFFKTATKAYIKNLREDFGQVRVLGMKELVPLESLYVRANVLEKIRVRSGTMPEEMEQHRSMYFEQFAQILETIDGEEIINREENLIVLGKPGAGKTTYLKYLTLRMTSKDKSSKIEQRRLPIFVTLHEFAKSGKTLLKYMAEQFYLCGFDDAQPFIERMLQNGDCIVFLDGLDEVSRATRLDAVIQEVTNFTRLHRESRFVVSCRVASYNDWFPQFKDVEIADFNSNQISDFVGKYFHKEPITGNDCWEKLRRSKSLLEMASSPLLLTLLCITYDERQDFPPNRAMLYGHAMDALLNRWDSSRRIKRDKLYRDLDEPRLLNLLSRLAAGAFENDIYFFREEDLCKGIGNFLADQMGEEARTKGSLVLKDIEQHYGLIVRRSQFAFSFSHLTFMEYFTAQYVVDKAGSGALDALIETHFREDRWLEVFLLTAGKLGHGTDDFLLRMQKENRKILQEVKSLNELFIKVHDALQSRESSDPKIRREAAGVFIVLERSILNLRYLDLIRSHDRSIFSALFLPAAKDIAIDTSTIEAAVRGFSGVTPQEIEKIESYLKGNVWLVKCLNSGATISTKVREQVLADLFKPDRG